MRVKPKGRISSESKKLPKTLKKQSTKVKYNKKAILNKKPSLEAKKLIGQKPRLVASKDLTYKYNKINEKWLILELREDVSLEESFELIEDHILSVLGEDIEYFMPVISEAVGDKKVSAILFDGYVFILDNPNIKNFNQKIISDHIKGFLISNNKCVFVTSKDINKFKIDLKKKVNKMIPKVGQIVKPKVGVFSDMEGKVISVDRKNLLVKVIFKKVSRSVEAPVNAINLDIMVNT